MDIPDTFCTVINCMDGRTQELAIGFLKNHFQADYVDSITEPGPVKILADESNTNLIESIKTRLSISVDKHKSVGIGVIAHHDCAGNPVEKDIQLKQLQTSVDYVKALYPRLPVLGIWVNENWEVEVKN